MIEKSKALTTVGRAFHLAREATKFCGGIEGVASIWLTKALTEDGKIDETHFKCAGLSYYHTASESPVLASALGAFANMLEIENFIIEDFISEAIKEMKAKNVSSYRLRIAGYDLAVQSEGATISVRADCIVE